MQCTKRWLKAVVAVGVLGITSFGCSAQKAPSATDETLLAMPTRDILVTDGDLNKPYDILGEVECTLKGKSTYSTTGSLSGEPSPELVKEAKDLLRKVAYTKYSEKVDAIINSKVTGAVEGGFFGEVAGAYGASTGTVSARGIAIAFKNEAQASPPAKSTARKKQQ